MDINKPRFELTSIYSDGSAEEPKIVPIQELPLNTNTNRRGFLGAGLVAGAALTFLGNSKLFARPVSNSHADKNFDDKEIYAHDRGVNALANTPDGKMLISASDDKTVKLWSLPSGKLLKVLKGHTDYVNAVSISPDGKILASGSTGKTIRLWSLPTGKLMKVLDKQTKEVNALAISPDGKILISASNSGTIKFWSLPDGELLKSFENSSGYKGNINTLSISPDGSWYASGSVDGNINLWSFPEGNLLKILEGHSNVNTISISRDGKLLASGSLENSIKLWSLPEGNLVKTLSGHSDRVTGSCISSDGKLLATVSWDKSVKLWSLPDGELLKTLEGHSGFVQAVSFSPDVKILASGAYDHTIRLWDLEKKEFIGFLFDRASNEEKGVTYNVYDKVSGTTRTFTLPCGSKIPSGAVCTCNCVAGTYKEPAYQGGGGGTYCTCNRVCTCIPVCQAHKLLHPDKFVRVLSREILLFMGIKEMDYMKWAADNSKTKLKAAITSLIGKIKRGLDPDYQTWPSVAECQQYLTHEDEVVSVMAAQMINLQYNLRKKVITKDLHQKVELLLIKSEEMHWKKISQH